MTGFSRVTIIELMEALERLLTVAEFNKVLLKYSLEDQAPASLGTKPKRLTALAEFLIDNPDAKGPFGANLTQELIEELIRRNEPSYLSVEEKFSELINSLKRDGYIVVDGELQTMLPEELNPPEKESELESLLEKFDFEVSKGHFEQAINAHTRGDWASANGQLRTFIESLFDQIAFVLAPDGTDLSERSSHGRRQFLAREADPPFFTSSLNEWEVNDGGFIPGFWRRLHPQGSHLGLSDEEDCTFRLHLVIIVANHFLRRLDSRRGPQPCFEGEQDIPF